MNRRGSILPVTLVLLAISATVLARVCRRGMLNALDANRQAEQLQQRWAMQSCQSTLLPRTGAILNAAEKAARRPVPALQATVTIAGQPYALSFADEQAKVNVNLVFHLHGSAGVQRVARDALRTSFAVRLRPLAAGSPTKPSADLPRAFVSPGQLFDERSLPAASLASATRELTCWGGGKLNWRRASARTLRDLLPGDNQTVSRILALQLAGPAASLSEVASGAPADKRKQLDDWLTDSSLSQSLWIVAPDGRARLAVREARDNGRTVVTSFEW